MYDTVVASTQIDLHDESMFTQQSVTDGVVRMWRNPMKGTYEPRLTYWRDVSGGHGRLRVEFSIPKMLGIELTNPTQDEVLVALHRVNKFLERLAPYLLSITDWQAQRIDYAWNFEPTEGVAAYVALLQGLWLGRMSRHPHPEAEGVVWKSRQNNHRWVKFYNKSREAGSDGTPVLRFEVSNYRRSLDYMCQHWLGCGRSVGELLRPGRALYVMARIWSRLGLFAATYSASGGVLVKLKELFGNGAAGAFYALMCITTYGADTHKVYHLMSDNSYYMWKRKLSEHDLFVLSSATLPPLSLPVRETISELLSLPQDLSNLPHSLPVPSSKNLPKNWEMWAKLLQVSKTSPEIGRFSDELTLSWERIYAEIRQSRAMSEGVGLARTKASA